MFSFSDKNINFATKRNEKYGKTERYQAIAFDADDTLWALQNYFEDVEHEYCELLSAYGKEKEISAALFETESRNMADLDMAARLSPFRW